MGVHLELRIDVQRFQPRIDGQAVAIEDHPFEADRFAVEQHQLDLGMRHPERLDHVLHRGGRRAGAGKHLPTPRGREEVVELLVEAECGPDHGGKYGRRIFGGRGRGDCPELPVGTICIPMPSYPLSLWERVGVRESQHRCFPRGGPATSSPQACAAPHTGKPSPSPAWRRPAR
ncbi:hypothetical protein D9M70_542520 [compost metagenome]